MTQILVQSLSGLASAASLFLVAAGLTVIFGVTRIVNFAHGSLYMLGAYIAYSLVTWLPRGHFPFWGGVLAAALAVGLIGVVVEVLVLRRIYKAPELFQLLATFGVVLVVQDVALAVWGAQDLLGPRAPGLRGAVDVMGERFPLYDLVLIAIGGAILLLLWLLFQRSRFGVLVRAATADREMLGALGVNQRRLFTGVFFLGSALAGLAGALQLPRESVNLHMDMAIISEAFVVVVVGGLGSLPGAALAALLIGQMQAFGIVLFPRITLVLVFLVMAVVLVLRPYGLMGRANAAAIVLPPEPPLRALSPKGRAVALAALLLAIALPPFLGDYALVVLSELAIAVLFAASLHFIMGPGGMASFGHAAYFGAGAYAAALLVKHFAAPMELGLLAAPFAAGLLGLVFGWFCVRLSGVYAAMLTLAFAQIAWSTAFQWVEVTGGDNGILGVWPSAWAVPKLAYAYLSLALCLGGALLLRRAIFAPLGYAMRAQRDSPLRAEAIGIDAFRVRWLAFAIAAGFAGLAGAVFAFGKGSVFPTAMAIPRSVDALLMVLLGGVQTVMGPLIGALAYTGLHEQLLRVTQFWRAALGAIIIGLVLFFPRGLAGMGPRA
ncbi:ABC transporter permease [Rhodovarius sp.]|uniref:ABC transporter permease n=1 Tax=Rhodovarius sp. TaxID=2972673 RepID=UPI0034A23F78